MCKSVKAEYAAKLSMAVSTTAQLFQEFLEFWYLFAGAYFNNKISNVFFIFILIK